MPKIIEYSQQHQPDFYALNAAWIEQFYALEEEDRRFLADPKRYIIDSGGMVFVLLEHGKAAGVCGVMKMDGDTYELVRMSVDAEHRGKGYGEALVSHACEWAAGQGGKQVILETGSALKPAIALYKRLGFEHYQPDPQHRSGLARADVFMRKPLD